MHRASASCPYIVSDRVIVLVSLGPLCDTLAGLRRAAILIWPTSPISQAFDALPPTPSKMLAHGAQARAALHEHVHVSN
eukprot:6751664-Prymnesium_polylepis.1